MSSSTINIQLVESLIQVIQSLSATEQSILLDKLLGESPAPSTLEMMHLAQEGNAFDFWHNEPDLYSSSNDTPS